MTWVNKPGLSPHQTRDLQPPSMSHCGDNTGESTTQVQHLYRQGTLQPDVHRCQAQVPWGQTSCPRGLRDCVIAQLHSEAEHRLAVWKEGKLRAFGEQKSEELVRPQERGKRHCCGRCPCSHLLRLSLQMESPSWAVPSVILTVPPYPPGSVIEERIRWNHFKMGLSGPSRDQHVIGKKKSDSVLDLFLLLQPLYSIAFAPSWECCWEPEIHRIPHSQGSALYRDNTFPFTERYKVAEERITLALLEGYRNLWPDLCDTCKNKGFQPWAVCNNQPHPSPFTIQDDWTVVLWDVSPLSSWSAGFPSKVVIPCLKNSSPSLLACNTFN